MTSVETITEQPQADSKPKPFPPRAPGPGRAWVYVLTPLLSLAIAALVAEAGLRVLCRQSLYLPEDEKKLMYRYDERLGWFPIADSRTVFTGYRTVHVSHNHWGFRGPEYTPGRQPGIVFLGDSFVWGFDVEAEERFTEKLQARHPEWSVYNFGVSGYGTDQEFLLLRDHFSTFKPRVIFLMFCTDNDDGDNAFNVRHGGYYKPYSTFTEDSVTFHGIPVPRSERVFYSEHPFLAQSYITRLAARAYFTRSAPPDIRNPTPTIPLIRELQRYARSKGSTLVLGLQRGYPRLEDALKELAIPYVDLTNSFVYPSHGHHWTPEGQIYVADKIEEFLASGRFMEPRSKVAGNNPVRPKRS